MNVTLVYVYEISYLSMLVQIYDIIYLISIYDISYLSIIFLRSNDI